MLVPNRYGSSDSYRYGFQGQEKDDELKGEGNSLNYTFRMHDPRIGRFFAVDPLTYKYPELTPYQFGGNRVIDRVELEGLESASDDQMMLRWQQEHVKTGRMTSEQVAAIQKGQTLGSILSVTGIIDIFATKGWLSRTVMGAGLLESMSESERGYEAQAKGNYGEAHRRFVNAGEASKLAILEGVGYLAAKGVGRLVSVASKLNRGGSKLVSSAMLEKYPTSTTYGNPNETFMSSAKDIDALLAKGLSREKIAVELGIEDPLFLEGDLIRIDIDIKLSKKLNIRNPTGNEVGANSKHILGAGKTPGGQSEKVVDGIPKNSARVSVKKIKEPKS